jgi:hypothetical protein
VWDYGYLLTSWETKNFWRRTLLHGVRYVSIFLVAVLQEVSRGKILHISFDSRQNIKKSTSTSANILLFHCFQFFKMLLLDHCVVFILQIQSARLLCRHRPCRWTQALWSAFHFNLLFVPINLILFLKHSLSVTALLYSKHSVQEHMGLPVASTAQRLCV